LNPIKALPLKLPEIDLSTIFFRDCAQGVDAPPVATNHCQRDAEGF